MTHIKLIHDDTFEHDQYLLWQKDIGLQNANLPALDSFSWWWSSSSSSSSSWSNREDKFIHHEIQEYLRLPQNITYIHVHKCGGTSIQGALYKRARSIRNTHFHIINNTIDNSIVNNSGEHQQSDNNNITMTMKADIHTYKHSFGGGSLEKKRQWDRQRLDHIKSIAIQQQSTLSTNLAVPSASSFSSFPIFTVVRDPIIRFFSAIQQVMQYNTEFREKCLFESPSLSKKEQSSFSVLLKTKLKTKLKNSKEEEEEEIQLQKKFRQQTISCAIQDMKETNYRNDVHLLPLASHFRLLDHLTLSVFWMDDIEEVLSYLSVVGNANSSDRSSSNDTAATISPVKVYHARDRSNVNYATSPILAKLSINDCSMEMIQQICELYHVDVELIRWLGFDGESILQCR